RVLKQRRRRGLLAQYDVVDAQARVPRDILRLEAACDGLLPAEPPVIAEFAQVVDLSAALPIDVHCAQPFRSEDAGCKIAAGVWEQEHGIFRGVGTRPR